MTKTKPEREKEIIRNLTEKINSLERQVGELWPFKDRFLDSQRTIQGLEGALSRRRGVAKVTVERKGILYCLELTKVEETPEGLFIEGRL